MTRSPLGMLPEGSTCPERAHDVRGRRSSRYAWERPTLECGYAWKRPRTPACYYEAHAQSWLRLFESGLWIGAPCGLVGNGP